MSGFSTPTTTKARKGIERAEFERKSEMEVTKRAAPPVPSDDSEVTEPLIVQQMRAARGTVAILRSHPSVVGSVLDQFCGRSAGNDGRSREHAVSVTVAQTKTGELHLTQSRVGANPRVVRSAPGEDLEQLLRDTVAVAGGSSRWDVVVLVGVEVSVSQKALREIAAASNAVVLISDPRNDAGSPTIEPLKATWQPPAKKQPGRPARKKPQTMQRVDLAWLKEAQRLVNETPRPSKLRIDDIRVDTIGYDDQAGFATLVVWTEHNGSSLPAELELPGGSCVVLNQVKVSLGGEVKPGEAQTDANELLDMLIGQLAQQQG